LSTSEDALRMIKIQHAKIGNTWWLQHDETQANPCSVSYAGNVSWTPHDARNVRIQNFGGSFLGASQCVKSLP